MFFICGICMQKVSVKDRNEHMIAFHGAKREEKKHPSHFGRPQSEESKLKRSIALKGRKHTLEHTINAANARKGWFHDSESNIKNSVWHINRWKNMTDEDKAAHIGRILKHGKHPNKKEKSLQKLLEILQLNYLYVGRGSVVINGGSPDFINQDKKKIIEFFGSHWHKEEDVLERTQQFKDGGYDCLIIWDKELGDLDRLVPKILMFDNSKQE